jgi:hypothetical protein
MTDALEMQPEIGTRVRRPAAHPEPRLRPSEGRSRQSIGHVKGPLWHSRQDVPCRAASLAVAKFELNWALAV